MDFQDSNNNAFLAIIGITAFFFLIWLTINVFFLLTQQNTLKLVQPQNRTMPPGQVWLQLIPLFSLVWGFIVVNRIAESIDRELSQSDFSFENESAPEYPFHEPKDRPTRSIGIAYCICFCCTWIPAIGTFIALAGLICCIVYWVEVVKYKKILQQRQWSRPDTQAKSFSTSAY